MTPEAAAVAIGLSVLAGSVLGVLLGWWMARMAKRTEAGLLRGYGIEPEQEPDRQTEPGS